MKTLVVNESRLITLPKHKTVNIYVILILFRVGGLFKMTRFVFPSPLQPIYCLLSVPENEILVVNITNTLRLALNLWFKMKENVFYFKLANIKELTVYWKLWIYHT